MGSVCQTCLHLDFPASTITFDADASISQSERSKEAKLTDDWSFAEAVICQSPMVMKQLTRKVIKKLTRQLSHQAVLALMAALVSQVQAPRRVVALSCLSWKKREKDWR